MASFGILLSGQVLMMLLVQVCDAKGNASDNTCLWRKLSKSEPNAAVKHSPATDLTRNNTEPEHRARLLVISAEAAYLALNAKSFCYGLCQRQRCLAARRVSGFRCPARQKIDRVEIDRRFLLGLAD